MCGRAALGLAVALAAAGPEAATIVLVPIKDNTIYVEDAAASNGAGEHLFCGRNGNNQTRRGLLAFGLSSIPAGSTITGASLEMYCTKATAGSGSQGVRLHRLLKSWGEAGSDGGLEEGQGGPAQTGDVTWTQRFYNSTPWAVAGGEFALSPSAATLVGLAGFYYTWTSPGMASDVQGWLDSPTTNQGWIVRGNEGTESTARRFASRQNGFDGFWPHLTVTYTPPAVTSLGATPDGGEVPGDPLTIARTARGDIELHWGASCVPSVSDYAVYQGPLGAFDDHTPVTCSTGGALTHTLPRPEGSVFWLIVPVDPRAGGEGSYGKRGDGSEIPPSALACFPQAIGDPVCP